MCPHGPEALPLPHTPVASGRRHVPARYADNRRIWINLRDVFPHHYTLADARFFLELMATEKPQTTFAIATASEAIGCIGLRLGADVHRRTAELGYWLGEPFWGRGIMTEAVGAFTPRAFEWFDLVRIYAEPFASNASSIRVLEKAGFACEGRLRAQGQSGSGCDSLRETSG